MLKRIVLLVVCSLACPCLAGEFRVLHRFDGVKGKVPYGSVIHHEGVLYGTTVDRAVSSGGTVYSLSLDGSTHTVLKSFDADTEGDRVFNSLALLNGKLYGVAEQNGVLDKGALFSVGTDGGAFVLEHNFSGGVDDGRKPYSAPAIYDGKLYGLTYGGGTDDVGVLYEHDPATGQTQALRSFTLPDGRPFGSVTPVGEWLYGMTSDHLHSTESGNVFRYRVADDTYEVVHSFAGGTAGGHPYDSLVWDGGDWLYGTTLGDYGAGGVDDEGVVFRLNIKTNGYDVLHDFAAQAGDGAKPNSAMLLAPDGYLYGISHGSEVWGGTEYGTLYRMETDGSDFELLHVFGPMDAMDDPMSEGDTPMRSLVWVDGVIYGTTAAGGLSPVDEFDEFDARGGGVVWSYTVIPEPATGLLLLLGLGLLRRRRMRD